MENRAHFVLSVAVAAVACGAGSSSVLAAAKPQGMQLGPGYFYPSVGLDVKYDDNILSQERNKVDSVVSVLSLAGREEVQGEASALAFEAGIKRAWYDDSSADNYLDWRAFAELATYPSERVSAKGKAGFWKLHEDRGTTTLQGDLAPFQADPDTYNLWAIDGEFGYGVEEPKAPKLELRAGYQDREYTNNRDITRFRDRSELQLGATVRYMIMPATSLLLDAGYRTFDYDRDDARLDSKEYRLLGGVTWEATAATTGFAKVGWQKKDFDSASRSDDDQPAWDVGIEWSPLSYSKFGLSTARKFDETTSAGDFVDRRETRLTWTHGWRTYLKSNLYVSRSLDDYANSPREDDLDGFGASLDYTMRDYPFWQLYFSYSDRDSSSEGLDYVRKQVGIKVDFAL